MKFDFGTWVEVKGQKVRAYPNNDGGLWYRDPETGEVEVFDERTNHNAAGDEFKIL